LSSNDARFDELKARVGKDLIGLWDVYASDLNEVVYRPISGLNYDQVVSERAGFRAAGLKFLATESAYTAPINREPGNGRRSGSFHRLDWFDASFHRILQPKQVNEIEERLERDSAWLSGGPRPEVTD
jgi:hypothetical protein